MKGIAFTLDALFALIITAAGISVLLYFHFESQTPQLISYNGASQLIKQLSATPIGSMLQNSNYSWAAPQPGMRNQTWDMFMNNPDNIAANPSGPSRQFISSFIKLPMYVDNGTLVSDYGMVFAGIGNNGYAINPYNGNIVWVTQAHTKIVADALAKGMFIYANATSIAGVSGTQPWLVATYASNGSVRWKAQIQTPTSMMIVYKNEAVLATNSAVPNVVAYNLDNGTLDWHFSYPSTPVFSVAALNGGILLANGTGLAYITDLDNNTQSETWHYMVNKNIIGIGGVVLPPLNPQTIDSQIVTYGNEIAFATRGVGTLPPQNVVTSQPLNPGNAVIISDDGITVLDRQLLNWSTTGVAAYNGIFVFLGSSNWRGLGDRGTDFAVDQAGNVKWKAEVSYYDRNAPKYSYDESEFPVANSTPVVSNGYIYLFEARNMYGTGLENNFATLAAQYANNGTTAWRIAMPYLLDNKGNITGESLNPYMALAYGRLFLSINNYLTIAGSCSIDPGSSALAAIATLYINGDYSCANYLFDRAKGQQKAVFYVGSGFNRQVAMESFNYTHILGTSSQGAVEASGLSFPSINAGVGGTVVAWIYPTDIASLTSWDATIARTTCGNGVNATSNSTNGFYITTWASGKSGPAHGEPNGQPFPFNSWYQVAVSYTNAGDHANVSVNGQRLGKPDPASKGSSCNGVTSTASSPGGTSFGYQNSKPSGAAYMYIANLQTYNQPLNITQIDALYGEGLNGMPLNAGNIGWYLLEGDPNNFASVNNDTGFPVNTVYGAAPIAASSYQISTSTVSLPLLNYSTGRYKFYNVSVYTWS